MYVCVCVCVSEWFEVLAIHSGHVSEHSHMISRNSQTRERGELEIPIQLHYCLLSLTKSALPTYSLSLAGNICPCLCVVLKG